MVLKKEDIWGSFNEKTGERLSNGMIVARHREKCPIWGDVLPYKTVTVVCKQDQYSEVTYWLEYVHGGNCITNEKMLDDGRVAFRSEYQCW